MSKGRLAASLLLLAVLAGLLLQLAELFDAHCESDADCRRPTVCRLVCRRNCKSVCVLLMEDGTAEDRQRGSKLSSELPNLGLKKGKMHRKPATKSEEEPFEGENPFTSGLSLGKLTTPIPPSQKANSESVTPLTISEAELEAELRQIHKTQGGPPGFVTVPNGGAKEMEEDGGKKTTASDPFGLKALGSSSGSASREHLAPPTRREKGKPSQRMSLTTLIDLVADMEDGHPSPAGHSTVPSSTLSSPPSFGPEPPGFTPSPTTTTTVELTTASSTLAVFTSTSSGTITTVMRGASREKSSSGERRGIPAPDSGGAEKSAELRSGDKSKPISKMWLTKTPLVRPATSSTSTGIPPGLVAMMIRTTQRLPAYSTPSSRQPPSTARSTLRRCPAPPVCGRNCGVVIDSDGCQSCQCLWISKNCLSDWDCRSLEGQFCDLGRCECGPGYEHSGDQSGQCRWVGVHWEGKGDEPGKQRGVPLAANGLPSSSPNARPGVPSAPLPATYPTTLISGRSLRRVPLSRRRPHSVSQSLLEGVRRARNRREATDNGSNSEKVLSEKPHREDRLQWPGPCDSDDQCPPQLYCVEGDCWTLEPDRALHRHKDQQMQQHADKTPTRAVLPVLDEDDELAVSLVDHPILHQHRPFPLGPAVRQQTSKSEHSGNESQKEEMRSNETGPEQEQRHLPTQSGSRKKEAEEQSSTAPPMPGPMAENRSISASIVTSWNRTMTTSTIKKQKEEKREENENSTEPNKEVNNANDIPQEQEDATDHGTSSSGRLPSSSPSGNNNTSSPPPSSASVAPNAPTDLPSQTTTVVALPPAIIPLMGGALGPEEHTTNRNNNISIDTVPVRPSPTSPIIPHFLPTPPTGNFIPQSIQMKTTILTPFPLTITPPLADGSNSPLIDKGMTSFWQPKRIFLDYSHQNRIRRPIRVAMANSRELLRDECHDKSECGRHFVCCRKRWCDLGGECGVARFCLPNCELTKLAHLSELLDDGNEGKPRMDLVYD